MKIESPDFAGKVCLVTGGSKGMGRALVQRLVAHSAQVAVLARESAAMQSLADEFGDKAVPFVCDMGDAAAIDRAVAEAAAHFGRIDAVVSNAAIVSLLKLESAPIADIQRELMINLTGPVLLTRAAIPHLRAAGGGDLVYISSESVRMPYPFLTLYGAAKGGIEVFAAGMRNELRAQGTRVTVLRSGMIEGTSLEDDWDPAVRDEFFAACGAMGTAATGGPATRATMAQAVVSLLALPRDVNADFVEIRGR